MRQLFFLLFLLIVQIVSAQSVGMDSLQRRYEQRSLLLQDNYFLKNNQKYPLQELDKELFASPAAYVMYRQGIRGYRWGRGLNFLGTAFNLGSLLLRNKDVKSSNRLIYSGIGLNLVGIIFTRKNKQLIDNAVFQYNKDLLFAPYFRH